MKRTLLALGCLSAVLTAALVFLLYEPRSEYRADAKRFVCIINTQDGYYWGAVRAGIAQADAELGTYTKYFLFERFDTEEQLRLLQETAYIQTDGIITVGEPFSDELNEAMASIVASGIPLVLLDTDSEASNRSCYIGSDNYSAGQIAAEKILEETGGDAHVVVFVSGLEEANQQERLDGFADTLAAYENSEILEVCDNQLDKSAIQEDIKQVLADYPNLNAIFCAEASTAQQVGFFTDSEETGREITVVGFDDVDPVLSFIEEGIYAATIVQQGFEMGYQAVYYLDQYQDSPVSEVNQVFTDVICITSDNVASYLEEKLDGQ